MKGYESFNKSELIYRIQELEESESALSEELHILQLQMLQVGKLALGACNITTQGKEPLTTPSVG